MGLAPEETTEVTAGAAVEEAAEMTVILPSLSSLPEVATEEAMEEATEGAAGRCLQRLPLGPS